MRPAFSNALYYPDIDIQNTDWLKTAVLFWDSISTIVPESVKKPYCEYETEYLADINFLRPLIVKSDDKSVVAIEKDIVEMMHSTEVAHKRFSPELSKINYIHGDNISLKVKEELKLGAIYPPTKKMERKLHTKYEDFWQQRRNITMQDMDRGYLKFGDEAYFIDDDIVIMYMSALTNRLCVDHSLAMVTDKPQSFDVGDSVRFGSPSYVIPDERFLNRRSREHQFGQGLLLHFIISGLSISPDAELPDIVTFKESHADELGRFRTQLAKLTQGFSADKSIKIHQNEISDLYRNEFAPAFEDLKAALKGSKIKWFADNFLKVSMMSAGATAVPMALLGMPIEQAIFTGAGMSVISSAISYSVDKKKILRENPYSYLLSIKREW